MPGNVPGQSCAGFWAAVTGMDQETALPQLRQGPAAQRRPHINTGSLSHSHIYYIYILQRLLGIVNETANVYFKGKLSKISPVDVSRLQTTTH